MAAEVVSLNGALTLAEAKPNQRVVQELERLLEAARAGEIVGIATACQHKNRVISYSYAGQVGGYGLIGGLDCVKERLIRLALVRG